MKENASFTEGKILKPLILFAFPVLLALFLQAMYGAVDLLVVGKFATAADVSAVSTGSQIMTTLTNLISSFAMGTTILLGQQIGCGKREEGGRTVGTAIVMFAGIAIVVSILLVILSPQVCGIMNAPAEAFDKTAAYVRICGGGMLVIVAYNLIGCIFRGLGDSRTPLVTVAIACVCNIVGDLLLCAVFHMGTVGAAIATVCAQVVSVLASWLFIRKQKLPFTMKREYIRIHPVYLRKMGRSISCQSAGVIYYEYPATPVSVPYRSGNADVFHRAADPVRRIYGDVEKAGAYCTGGKIKWR